MATPLSGTEARICADGFSCLEKAISDAPRQDVTYPINQLFFETADEIEYSDLAIFRLGPSGWEQYFQPSKPDSLTRITFNAAVGSAVALTTLNLVPFWGPKALAPLETPMFNACAASMSLEEARFLGEQPFKPSAFSAGPSGVPRPVSNLAVSRLQFFGQRSNSIEATTLSNSSSETRKEAGQRPQNPTPVPIPATLWLLLAGVAGLSMTRIRRDKAK
ncbi:MAG: VPLPA-CTERM sorting domain-containing protein [Litoreibacter sp.]|nr:VPLPA-CTERM sorting domain-containing protein [Litoreibacter sp.]